jgi:hypothetical protein
MRRLVMLLALVATGVLVAGGLYVWSRSSKLAVTHDWRSPDSFAVVQYNRELVVVGIAAHPLAVAPVAILPVRSSPGVFPSATVLAVSPSQVTLAVSVDATAANQILRINRASGRLSNLGNAMVGALPSLAGSTLMGAAPDGGSGRFAVNTIRLPDLGLPSSFTTRVAPVASDRDCIVGSDRTAQGSGSYLLTVQNATLSERLVARDSVPGSVACRADGAAAVSLTSQRPHGTESDQAQTLPDDHRVVVMAAGRESRTFDVGRQPHDLTWLNSTRLAVDIAGETGRQVAILDTESGHVTRRWSLPAGQQAATLTELHGLILAVSDSRVSLIGPDEGVLSTRDLGGQSVTVAMASPQPS